MPAQPALLWNPLDAFQKDLLIDLDSQQRFQTPIVRTNPSLQDRFRRTLLTLQQVAARHGARTDPFGNWFETS
jgi:hypothetical protein